MKIIQKNKEKIIFSDELDESMANAIRRNVSEIPALAIDEVEIHKNDSALYDEVLAHRLGLIPLENPGDMVLKEECSCKGKGCLKCEAQLKLVAKGPCTVYSKDLKGKASVVYGNIPVVILNEEQELEIICYARLGKGIGHVKYSPGLAYYRHLADVKIHGKIDREIMESCPLKIINEDGIDIEKCDLCEACIEKSKEKGKNTIEIKPGKEIIFFIESFGQMEAKDILVESIKALKENLKSLSRA